MSPRTKRLLVLLMITVVVAAFCWTGERPRRRLPGCRVSHAGPPLHHRIYAACPRAVQEVLDSFPLRGWVKWRGMSTIDACRPYLKQLDGALEQWALENKKTAGDPVEIGQIAIYLKNSKVPECPYGGTYRVTRVGRPPTCSLAPRCPTGIHHTL
jgi:hypothetical protein